MEDNINNDDLFKHISNHYSKLNKEFEERLPQPVNQNDRDKILKYFIEQFNADETKLNKFWSDKSTTFIKKGEAVTINKINGEYIVRDVLLTEQEILDFTAEYGAEHLTKYELAVAAKEKITYDLLDYDIKSKFNAFYISEYLIDKAFYSFYNEDSRINYMIKAFYFLEHTFTDYKIESTEDIKQYIHLDDILKNYIPKSNISILQLPISMFKNETYMVSPSTIQRFEETFEKNSEKYIFLYDFNLNNKSVRYVVTHTDFDGIEIPYYENEEYKKNNDIN